MNFEGNPNVGVVFPQKSSGELWENEKMSERRIMVDYVAKN